MVGVPFALAAALLVMLSATAGAAVHVEPEPTFALPPTSMGCAGVVLGNGVGRIPITVSTVAGQVAETVNVCIGGSGPYPFVLDTGSGESTIDAGLANRLHLAQRGAATTFEGVGCTGTARPVSVPAWSVAGLPLVGQTLTAAHLPQIGGKGEPDGLLGSDVLSRFGAVRIDFRAGALILRGPEAALPAQRSTLFGPVGPAPSALLTGGGQGMVVPTEVVRAPGDESMDIQLHFGHGPPRTFVVDSGSSQSVVATSVASAQRLAGSNLAQRQSTVCSNITVPLVHSGKWGVPGVSLHPQLIGKTDFGPIGAGGVSGLLGSDQLIRYGWIVVDYSGGRLILG
jgi:hypothetical protein